MIQKKNFDMDTIHHSVFVSSQYLYFISLLLPFVLPGLTINLYKEVVYFLLAFFFSFYFQCKNNVLHIKTLKSELLI